MKVYGTVNIKGKFWPQRTSGISEVEWTSTAEGRLLYDTDNDNLHYGSSTEWVQLSSANDLFTTGSKLIFASTLPSNWNIDSEINDKMIVLTNNSSELGNTGGVWELSGMNYSSSHKHFTPSGLGDPSLIDHRGKSELYSTAGYKTHKHNFTSEGVHKHSFEGTWRPAHVKFIVGVFQG